MQSIPSIKQSSAPRSGPKTKKLRAKQTKGDARTTLAPSAMTVTRVSGAPKVQPLPNGEIVVENSEWLKDIGGTSNVYAPFTTPINPGLPIFAWLNTIAVNYESYVWEFLRFEYRTLLGTASTGYVVMFIDYDPSDPLPISKGQALSNQGAIEFAPWMNTTLVARQGESGLRKRKTYYVRSGPLDPAANMDLGLYDACQFVTCNGGQASSALAGSVHVSYRIRFMTPQAINPATGLSKGGAWGMTAAGGLGPLKFNNMLTTQSSVANVTTFLFTTPFIGWLSVYAEGVGLSAITTTGTASRISQADAIAAGTSESMANFSFAADPGETVIVTVPNTAVTAGSFTIMQAPLYLP